MRNALCWAYSGKTTAPGAENYAVLQGIVGPMRFSVDIPSSPRCRSAQRAFKYLAAPCRMAVTFVNAFADTMCAQPGCQNCTVVKGHMDL